MINYILPLCMENNVLITIELPHSVNFMGETNNLTVRKMYNLEYFKGNTEDIMVYLGEELNKMIKHHKI